MLEINWRFAFLAVQLVIVIILQIIAMKERKVLTMIQDLIRENSRTNEKLTDTLKEHSESTKEQGKQIMSFEREMTKEISRLQGAVGKK